jgi:hypothetical protein
VLCVESMLVVATWWSLMPSFISLLLLHAGFSFSFFTLSCCLHLLDEKLQESGRSYDGLWCKRCLNFRQRLEG